MNKLTIIQLLTKIANKEEVPKKIKFCFRTFEYNGIDDYLCIDKNDYSKEDYCNGYSIHKWIFGNNLNDEIEIIEDKPKKIEKIGNDYYHKEQDEINEIFQRKLNEIIDFINNIKNTQLEYLERIEME